MKYMKSPYVAALICMILFVVMYNNATTDFMRICSYVPLAVLLAIFLKGVYYAYCKRNN